MEKSSHSYRYILAALLCLSVNAGALAAQPAKVTIHLDPARTDIRWALKATGHTVHGSFKLKGGVVGFDPATGVASGELLVDLSTGDSGDKSRDDKMKSDVLETGKYPQCFFHPSKISGELKPGVVQGMTADGTFNIHGADHPLKLDIQVKLDGNQATATTHFIVPYVAWGMKDPGKLVLRVDKQVDVDVVAHGTVDGLVQ